MALANAFVKNAQIFGNGCDGTIALGESGVEIFFLCSMLRVHFLAFGGNGSLRLAERGFRGFQAALGIFSGHHDFELAVFGLGDFRFGVGNFVLSVRPWVWASRAAVTALRAAVSFRSASRTRLGKASSSTRNAAMCWSMVWSSRRRGIAGCIYLKFSTALRSQ